MSGTGERMIRCLPRFHHRTSSRRQRGPASATDPMTTATKLTDRRCVPCEGGVAPLTQDQSRELLTRLGANWKLSSDNRKIEGHFEFKNYFRTTAFVNAVAWIAIHEDHHPDIAFSYKNCDVTFWTHAIDGLSENDFICAAKVDALLA